MEDNLEVSNARYYESIPLLNERGFRTVGNWLFYKAGKLYDLSAADLSQTERIEREGLFVVQPDEGVG